MAAVTIHSDFGAQENKICHCFHFFPFYLPRSDGIGCHDLSFLSVEFQASFFTLLIKRLFSSSSLSAIRVVSSAYLRLLIFLPSVLIPACDSASPALLMMHSAYKLNKQGANIQPWRIPFPIWNQSVVPFPVLTVASWPAYRFLRQQVRWSGIPISRRFCQNFLWSTRSNPHTQKNEMVGWHHQLYRYEFEQALGIGDGQGSLACCSPWGRKESDTTEWLNWMQS